MLTQGTDPLYRSALARSHTAVTRVEVWQGDTRIVDDLPFISGSVTANLISRVSRTLSFTIDESWYPKTFDDVLSPFVGHEIRVNRGVKLGNGYEFLFPVFRGTISSVDYDDGEGAVDVTADDHAQFVINAGFVVPRNSSAGASVVSEVQDIIRDAVPNASFGPSDSFTARVPVATWESDRGQALDELTTAVGALWYPLADGRFVIRRVPWTVASLPVVTLSDGDNGILMRLRSAMTKDNIFNSVTVISERTDGTTPAYGIAEDINPQSATYVNGPLGKMHKLLRLQMSGNQSVAKSAAEAYLKRSTARTETWTWDQIPDASLELGDTVELHARKRTDIIQVITNFQMPLETAGQTMSVTARSQMIGGIDE